MSPIPLGPQGAVLSFPSARAQGSLHHQALENYIRQQQSQGAGSTYASPPPLGSNFASPPHSHLSAQQYVTTGIPYSASPSQSKNHSHPPQKALFSPQHYGQTGMLVGPAASPATGNNSALPTPGTAPSNTPQYYVESSLSLSLPHNDLLVSPIIIVFSHYAL